MNPQRKCNSIFAALLALLLTATTSGFQQRCSTDLSSMSTMKTSSFSDKGFFALSSMPPNYDDSDFDSAPYSGGYDQQQDLPPQSIPKLKVPKPSMPEIDVKESLKKLAILGITVLAFVAIQKGGLILSDIFTPELSPEQVADFRL